ncbi:10931_t:CDS:2 [Diversispora eburnea]|uniref:10931_t:CDS:1 n=1 Tax=Diversispora eburnea TaxID=1213867 RepID=A0A9N8YWD3_9GLOM|nr:10931_t:CDS:2 [Diversispora eburnea]
MSNLTSTSTSSKINVSTSQTRTTINLSPSNVDNSDFQDFFKNSRGHEIYSDRFSSPSETFQSPSTTNPGFSWRLNQVTDMNYKSNEKIDLNCTSTSSNEKIDEKDSEMILLRSIPPSTEMYFPDDVRELTSHGIKNFCDFETIFPEKNFDQSITLVIIINFYKLEIEEINNIDDDSENMNGNFIESFNNPICSDILFNLDCGSKIYAKSEFLAMKSPFFKKLFDGEVTFQEVEAGVKRVFIKNTKYDYFRLVIYFAYTGKIESLEEQNLSYDDLIQLLMMAQSFEYKEFGNEITLRLGNIINLENWDEILLINKRIGCSELKCKVLKFINENWNQIRDINWIKKFVDLDDFELIEEIFEAKFFKH